MKSVIEAHRGKIGINSKKNKGSEFSIFFTYGLMNEKLKILLVEDDANLGYILKEYLQVYDFAVEWAKDGEAGLAQFKKSSYDLCILDVMMPKMDGFTLAEKIKSFSPEVPLIFLTAKALKIDKLKGFKMGAG